MDLDALKNFINHDVQLLVGGVWISGRMTPIVKGVVTLLPFEEDRQFYGPTACKAEVVQVARQIKRGASTNPVANQGVPPVVQSAFNPPAGQGHPGSKFVFPTGR